MSRSGSKRERVVETSDEIDRKKAPAHRPKKYRRPRIVVYGRIKDLTRGSTGKTDDFNFTFRPP